MPPGNFSAIPTENEIGAGKLLLDRLTSAGASTGFHMAGNVPNLDLGQAPEIKTLFSAVSAARGVLAEVPLRTKFSITATMNAFQKELLAMALLGPLGEITQSSTAVTNEVHAPIIKGAWTQLRQVVSTIAIPRYNLTAVTITGPGGTTPVYTTPADYILDPKSGMLFIPASSTIDATAGFAADFTYGVTAWPQIAIGTTLAITCGVKFLSDATYGPKVNFDIWKASVYPQGNLGMISEDFASFQLTITALDDSATPGHETTPFGQAYIINS